MSTKDQDLDVQRAKAKEVGADKVYAEKISGLDQDRPRLKACLDYLREGDTLYVMRADRLGRSTLHLLKIMELMLSILAAIAEFETALGMNLS